MDASLTYFGNYFTIYINQTIMMKALKLYSEVCQYLSIKLEITIQPIYQHMGFPGDSVVKNLHANTGDEGSILGSGRSIGGDGKPTSVYLPGDSHGQRSLVATIHEVAKR